jgi:hypothetical protein
MFGPFPCSWVQIRIRSRNTDPDSGELTQYGSMQIPIDLALLDPDPHHRLYEHHFLILMRIRRVVDRIRVLIRMDPH